MCTDGDAIALALQRVIATFDLRDGNGRLKNMLDTKKHMPPRILINCVVRAAGCPPIMAEIQIYLDGIKKIADLQHRYYEIRRATALAELIAEANAHTKSPPEPEPEPSESSTPPQAVSGAVPKLVAAETPLQEQVADEPPRAPEISDAVWQAFCNT